MIVGCELPAFSYQYAEDLSSAFQPLSMIPTLPPELLSQIASELHDDKRTLAAAAIVSTAWLGSFREVLFNKIRVCENQHKRFLDTALFLEGAPSVRPLIVALELRGDITKWTLQRILSSLPRISSIDFRGAFLPEKVEKAPSQVEFSPLRLDSLRLRLDESMNGASSDDEDMESTGKPDHGKTDQRPKDYYQDRYTMGMPAFPATRVAHDMARWPNPFFPNLPNNEEEPEDDSDDADDEPEGLEDAQALVDVLMLFSHATKFHLEYSWNLDPWVFPVSELEKMLPNTGILSAEAFTFSQDETQSLTFAFLRRLLNFETLRTMTVGLGSIPDREEWRSLLRSGTNLTSLALTVATIDPPLLCLTDCIALESLSIQPRYSTDDDENDFNSEESDADSEIVWNWKAVRSVLSHNASQIRHLTIAIGIYPASSHRIFHCLKLIEWEWLEDRISSHYPNIETLTFLYNVKKKEDANPGTVEDEVLVKFIEKKLTILTPRGIVRVRDNKSALQNIYPWYGRPDSSSEEEDGTGSDIDNNSGGEWADWEDDPDETDDDSDLSSYIY